MGFTAVARHRSKDVLLYRQGRINFIVNREPTASRSLSRACTGRAAAPSRCA
jgi:4-hydroxyphenylpyruvate dioxygenase